jgi:hypothetical protein
MVVRYMILNLLRGHLFVKVMMRLMLQTIGVIRVKEEINPGRGPGKTIIFRDTHTDANT